MKISDIYKKYKIPANLAEHMIRVAVVGHEVAKSWRGEADVELTTLSCLLHDIGNIVKFNWDSAVVKVDNLDYWKEVQGEFRGRYGTNAHTANVSIIREIGRNDIAEIIEREHEIFGEDLSTIKDAPLPAQILLYSDIRVMPKGIVSMRERIEDLINRYGDSKYEMKYFPEFEEYLQEMTEIDIREINEGMVNKYRDQFLSVTI